jgi:MFS transporter, AAHS family, 4-hydroxybenzoate transporter
MLRYHNLNMRDIDTRSPAPIDVTAFIDEQPVGRLHIRLLVLCAAVLFMDGFDTQAMGYVAPALTRDWQLARGALGPALSAGLFGLMIGALVLGPVADRIGRKRIIVWSAVAFGIGTVATTLASDLHGLIVIRFLTGLGLGGAMPNTFALMAEFSPRRRRATLVMIMFCGFSVGAAVGGLVAAGLIPAFGWRSVFVVGGVAPLLFAPMLARMLPESIRFLAAAEGGRENARIAQLLSLLAPTVHVPPNTRFVVNEPGHARMPVAELFASGAAATTLLRAGRFDFGVCCDRRIAAGGRVCRRAHAWEIH